MTKEKGDPLVKKFNKAWIGVIAWMILILFFSSQGGEASSALSQSVTQFIVNKLENIHLLPAGSRYNTDFFEHMEKWLRQLAHFGLFMILGVFIANAFRIGKSFGWKLWVFSLLFCIGYALFDEILQRFSPGRAFEAIDIITDGLGGFVGILLYIGLVKLYYKIKGSGHDVFQEVKQKSKQEHPLPYHQAKDVYCDVPVHLVFVTKDKRPVLTGQVALLTRSCIKDVCAEFGMTIQKGYIAEDHVHLILKLIPDVSLNALMHRILSKTNRAVLLEKRLLDPKLFKRHMWHPGYFIASASNIDDNVIQSYIDSPEIDTFDTIEVFSISENVKSVLN